MKPSAVLEFDANTRGPGKTPVQIRRPDESSFLVLSNHYCVRRAPNACERFERIAKGLRTFAQQGKQIGIKVARKLLIAGELPTAAHSLIFLPDRMTVYVALTRGNILSPRIVPKPFLFKEVFRPAKAAAEK